MFLLRNQERPTLSWVILLFSCGFALLLLRQRLPSLLEPDATNEDNEHSLERGQACQGELRALLAVWKPFHGSPRWAQRRIVIPVAIAIFFRLEANRYITYDQQCAMPVLQVSLMPFSYQIILSSLVPSALSSRNLYLFIASPCRSQSTFSNRNELRRGL